MPLSSAHFFVGPGPVVIAHRGGAGLRPENTLAAFANAAALGADAVECDVHLSRDGDVVVIHDATLDRTTDASGPVGAFSADELARVDSGARFKADEGTPFRGLGGVPRLRDVLAQCPLPVVLELKGSDPALARAAVAVVRDAGALDRVCFAGFDDRVVQAAREAAPEGISSAATSEIRWAIYRAKVGLAPRAPRFQCFQLPERYGPTRVISKGFLRVTRRAGLPVQVWIVNDPADMTRLFEWGVQGVITDLPDVALQMVGRNADPRA